MEAHASLFNPRKWTTYTITAIINSTRMMQQMMYPTVVTVLDVMLRTVMPSTMAEMMNSMMNSYMYDRRTCVMWVI